MQDLTIFLSRTDHLLDLTHLLAGLVLVILGLMLLRRMSDPAVKILIGWGGLWLLSGAYGEFFQWYYISDPSRLPPPPWVNLVSLAQLLGGRLLLYVTAGYAVYRLWTSSRPAPHDRTDI